MINIYEKVKYFYMYIFACIVVLDYMSGLFKWKFSVE